MADSCMFQQLLQCKLCAIGYIYSRFMHESGNCGSSVRETSTIALSVFVPAKYDKILWVDSDFFWKKKNQNLAYLVQKHRRRASYAYTSSIFLADCELQSKEDKAWPTMLVELSDATYITSISPSPSTSAGCARTRKALKLFANLAGEQKG